MTASVSHDCSVGSSACCATCRARPPVLLTLEDVHLADTSSRDFVRFLAQSLRSERLLTVATVRSDELHREHPVRTLMAELQRYDRVTRNRA